MSEPLSSWLLSSDTEHLHHRFVGSSAWESEQENGPGAGVQAGELQCARICSSGPVLCLGHSQSGLMQVSPSQHRKKSDPHRSRGFVFPEGLEEITMGLNSFLFFSIIFVLFGNFQRTDNGSVMVVPKMGLWL